MDKIIKEGRAKEQNGLVFFPSRIIGADTFSGEKASTDVGCDDTLLGLGDFKAAGEDVLALLEQDVVEAAAPQLAITDGTDKLGKEINAMDELYVRCARTAKVAKQALSLVPPGQTGRNQRAVQDLQDGLEASSKILSEVPFCLDYKKTQNGHSLTPELIADRISSMSAMVEQLLGDAKFVRMQCIPKKSKQSQ